MARILHTRAGERYRADVVRAPRDKGGITGGFFAIALLSIIGFGHALTFGFVYDDHWTVEGNRALDLGLVPLLGTLLSGQGVARGIPDATRPTMVTSMWLDRRLFGLDPAGHHLHSLLLYCVCASLAAVCVFAVTRSTRAALAGGLLFAIAPAHAEVVAAINYREDLESAFSVFALVAWLFCPRARDSGVCAALAALSLIVGLLAKESAVVLFPIALAIASTRFRVASLVRQRRTSLAALGFTAVAWAAWRAWLRLSGRDDVPLALEHRGILERVLRTARYAVRATFDGAVPIRWSPEYAPEGTPSISWLVPLVGLVALIVWLSKHRRLRAVAAGLAVALVAPLATSPLVSPVNETADRYVFIGSLGGAIVWGTLVDRFLAFVPEKFRLLFLGSASIPLIIMSHQAIVPFQSDADLWRVATERAPLSPRAFAGLSRVRRLEGDLDGADRAVERALRLDPRSLTARLTRVYNHLARGDVAAARADIRNIQAMGGGAHRGVPRAVRCAALEPAKAARCIDAPRETP